MRKVTYGGGDATKKTSKKTLNKVMPIKAENGEIIPGATQVAPLKDDRWAQPTPIAGGGPITPIVPTGADEDQIMQTDDPGYFRQHPLHIAGKLSTNNLIAGTLAAANSLLPEEIKRDNQNRTPMMYNPRGNGDGTQAISKFGNTFEGGGQVTDADRESWNKYMGAMRQDPQYGSVNWDHDTSFQQRIAQQTGFDPNKISTMQQDMIDRNQSMPGTVKYGPDGLSKADNWTGHQTKDQSYRKYEYIHLDKNGKQYDGAAGHIAPTFTPMSKEQMNGWSDSAYAWKSNDQGVPMNASSQEIKSKLYDIPTPAPVMAAKPIARAQKASWHEDGPAPDYSIDSVRSKYGKTMKNGKKCADGGSFEDFEDYDEAQAGIEMLGKGNIKPIGDNAYSHPMMWSQGPSHDEGGMPIDVNGQRAEIQGGEGIYPEANGNTTVFGGMRIPNLGPDSKGLSGRTFQSVAKEIGKQEEKNQKLKNTADLITDNNDPANRFDSLKIGSAMAMESAFKMRSATATAAKDSLAGIQRMMHEDADKNGVGYEKAHQIYAKKGATIIGKDGFSQSIQEKQRKMMQEHPDWVKEAMEQVNPKTGKPWGMPKAGTFDDGLDGPRTQYIGSYVDRKIAAQGARPNFGPESDPDMSSMYAPTTKASRYAIPPTGVAPIPEDPADTAPWRAGMTDQEAQDNINNRKTPGMPPTQKMRSLADQNKLRLADFFGEINYMGKRPDQVLSPEYRPYLETPYQVSFQDRRNLNQSTFNEVAKQLQGSGSAASLAALAGQKYEADNQVNAEEFRTNQGIYNSITNQNYNTLNDANKFNTGLKDQQFTRQAQAKSNTDAQRAQALASISNKIAANRYENMNIRLTEERSGYRWNPNTKRMEWEGGPHTFDPYGSGQGSLASNTRKTFHYDKDGLLTGHDEVDYNDNEDLLKQSKALKAQRSVYTKFGNVFK